MATDMRQKTTRSETGSSERILTTDQVADMLQVSQRTIQRAIVHGGLKARKVGRGWRVRERDLWEWWEAGQTKDC
jgi:excisionase family DNA binding protein